MIKTKDLIILCRERAIDAQALLNAKRYDGAVYLCGYVVELALKIRICKTLKWEKYPPNNSSDFKAFKTHNLDFLLTCSGKEPLIKKNHLSLWSYFTSNWNSEKRYDNAKINKQAATELLEAAKTLQNIICKI